MSRSFSPACAALARAFETFVPFTYDDAHWPPVPARASVPVLGTLTIGYGQTGKPAFFGARCTEDQAAAWLDASLTAAAEIVDRDCAGVTLTDGQFDALTDFVFSAGAGNFEHSTLLRELLAGDVADIPAQLARWVFQGGRKLAGLERRRAAEIALWESNKPQGDSPQLTSQPETTADDLNTAELAGINPAT